MATELSGKTMQLGKKIIPVEHFNTKRKRSKKGRIARAVKAEEPKVIEEPKQALFFKGLRASEPTIGFMKDIVRCTRTQRAR